MLLNLPGWIIDRTEESRHDLLIAEPSPDYGADISTLRRLLEDGRL